MEVMIVIMLASLIVALIFLGAYIWAVRSGQYDDKFTPSVRILFEPKSKQNNDNKNESSK